MAAAGTGTSAVKGISDLDRLWNSVRPSTKRFDPADVGHLPQAVQRYLLHAIRPGALLASAVRLRMHGAIRLKHWRPFAAEQVIAHDRGMIWRAKVRTRGASIRGFDRYLDGAGKLQWKLGGVIPIIRASGPDITRSSADRYAAELVWLPSALLSDRVSWSGDDTALAHARITVGNRERNLALRLNIGFLQSVSLARWGNPDSRAFREVDFGAIVEQEASFRGYTIPARLRAGWYFGSERFETEGEFFRVTIDDAVFR